MSDYKLLYFPLRGRAEPIRWLFHFTGMEFTDERIEFSDWPEMKEEIPQRKLPVLEYRGKQFYQTKCIGRFLARQFGLCGDDDMSAAMCDQIVDDLSELIDLCILHFHEKNEEKKEEYRLDLIQVKFPLYMAHFEKCIEKTEGKYLVDFGITWADIFVACWMENFIKLDENMLDDYPHLRELNDDIRNIAGIKEWIDNRPESAI